MRDFCIVAGDAPDNLASIGKVLGDAGVNIAGLCLTGCDGVRIIHFVVEDAVTARHVLEESGIKIKDESEVFVLDKDEKGVTGKPGRFGRICRILADHNIAINFAYPAENNRFVFGVDDVAMARRALELLT